ncbi:helix-turn-helix domain-containing protein [Rhodococcus sp. USK10]|uniref:Sugar diacid utilization regulator SdaR n=1 Tax=Rhodococcus wratislaviensis TaxID=44752 RepID=A0A402C5L8_RHOWR|nr:MULTISPECIES: sugar diacid recognition domain-containing protein [Rhodococcus]QYB07186.1 helix-turn-helix domain-containing protein [Rhodococcus sp. USK10]GCE38883.1 Sugar diacid utilization regulator SdaR [Rhodococcus wratislaviensis]
MTWAVRDGDEDEFAYVFTGELAQRVVDEVSPRLDYNINLMDRNGRIIGSVDGTRIGTVHAGALQAIRDGRRVLVDADEESPDVRAGINIPLTLDGRIVGAVGVTGDPDEVESVCNVLALTVELLLRNERHRDSSRWREAAVRELLLGLVNGTVTENGLLEALRHIGSPMAPPWNIAAVVPAAGGGSWSLPSSTSVALLRRVQGISGVVAAELRGAVWVLSGSVTDRTLATTRQRLRTGDVRLVTGRHAASSRELSVDAARLGLLLARAHLLPAGEVTELSALVPETAVAQQSREISHDTVERVLTPLSATLRETARAFLDHDLSIAATATALEVHRNTLVQRLDRIQHVTGLNLRTFDHAVAMRLALLAAAALEDPYNGA